jgi:hypothetical protein
MKISIAHSVLLIITVFINAACSNADSKDKSHRYQGHYTLAAGGSCFTTIDQKKRYIVYANDMPNSVYEYLKSQPRHKDIYSESNYSVSAYADVLAKLIYEPSATRFHAEKVFLLSKAKPMHIKSRCVWPPIDLDVSKSIKE